MELIMSGVDDLKEKVEKGPGSDLTVKERRVIGMALKFLQNCMYEKIPNVPFICGKAGEDGKDGMPEFFFIAPTYGVDGFAVYKKDKDYDGPGY
jgi:hypothetical protein